MNLPTLDAYAFPVTLPSTQQSITMRPYLVREEKLLLMAQESDNVDEQIEAVAQIIRNCTNGAVEPKTAPYFDVEYLLLQLRSRSVGEVATPIYECHTVIEDSGECKHTTPVTINLSTVPVSNLIQDPARFLITLNEKYTLKLRYPTIYTVSDLLVATLTDRSINGIGALNTLTDLFDSLEDASTGAVYRFDDYNQAEKNTFMESLTPSDFDKVVNFLDDTPSVSHTTTFECERCKTTHTIVLKGLSDFLV